MPRYKITQTIDTIDPEAFVHGCAESHEITEVGPSVTERVSKTTHTLLARLPKRQQKVGNMTVQELAEALDKVDHQVLD